MTRLLWLQLALSAGYCIGWLRCYEWHVREHEKGRTDDIEAQLDEEDLGIAGLHAEFAVYAFFWPVYLAGYLAEWARDVRRSLRYFVRLVEYRVECALYFRAKKARMLRHRALRAARVKRTSRHKRSWIAKQHAA